ncbi:universal stress protein [Streptomyces sp. SID14478]|uniref:universal stress protein n=1 Tax=Streptomyces sp. SID14478 TaxID=2706073 RepID=UPI0013D99F02|nr:universal stress protein [Streptomyces sp. SID14478]NEB76363.1 universal stress protein [Streptomyces sp. SID14478]
MIQHTNDQPWPVVVGVDGSACSQEALRWGLAQAHVTGSALEAVAAWQYPEVFGYSYGWTPSLPDGGEFAKTAEQSLRETVDTVRNHLGHSVEVTIRVTEGHPVQVLMDAARNAQLLVLGSRGHGTFTGMMLGSVSQHCVQHAPCPVVVVPQP